MLTMVLSVKRSNLKKQQSLLFSTLDTLIKSTGKELSNEIRIPKDIFNATTLQFKDISHQSPTIQKFLGKMVDRGLVKNKTTFNGESPMTWGEFIPWYIKVNYNKNLADLIPGRDNVRFEDVVMNLGVQMNSYIPANYYKYFEMLMQAGIAGVEIKDKSEFGLHEFERQKETLYAGEWEIISDWEYSYF
jgi:hypothetical protein